MLLTITTTHRPATDLGYLLEKHPARAQRFELAWGAAHVFYPEASEERCTAALMIDLDPLRLVKGARKRGAAGSLSQYVNDRPYVASSLLSVAIAEVLASALRGKSRERPELAARAIPLSARLPAITCRGGEALVRALFAPLGYEIELTRHSLDAGAPPARDAARRPMEWGPSSCFDLTLRGEARLSELLSHLYVLIPVLDDEKHYFVGLDEVEKLVARGEGWLAAHPARDAIATRYLKRQRHLARAALARLATTEEELDAERDEVSDAEEGELERRVSLDTRRREAVIAALRAHGAESVLDLGCGEGKLVGALAKEGVPRVAGAEVSSRALEVARERLERLDAAARERVTLLHASAVYRDARFSGFDAICLVEVIEHVDPPRLPALCRVVFEQAAPRLVIVTTPNREHNVRFRGLAPGALRHRDHRFELTRAELAAWAEEVAARFGYSVTFAPIGDDDPEVGPPTQMAVFTRGGAS